MSPKPSRVSGHGSVDSPWRKRAPLPWALGERIGLVENLTRR
jgi:hypothetical protein